MTRRPETEILETVYRRSAQIRLRRRMLQISVGVVALVLVLTTSPALVRQLAFQEVDSAGQPGAEDSRKDGTEQGNVEGTEMGRPGSDGPPAPGSSSGGRGSSSKRGSGSGSLEGTTSQDPETAGPPVYYTDQADDAYGSGMSPNAALSDRAFDILRVDWAPVSGGYSTSITVAGTASDDGSYVSHGYFYPGGGETCWIYYFLKPGATAFANAFCESSGDQWGLVGVVEGDEVTSTPTAAGGTRLTATFDKNAIPPLLQTAGRRLHLLSAFTCEGVAGQFSGNDRNGVGYCGQYGVLDEAHSFLSYRV